jgi:Domain of unknown function (DUF4421)
MQIKHSSKAILLQIVLFSSVLFCSAQKRRLALPDTSYYRSQDTLYYSSYDTLLAVRLYLSQKYTALVLKGGSQGDLRYQPNTTTNLGIGATYKWLTLNLGYGISFLNNGEEVKGKTKYLDLQTHIYGRKNTVDLLGQFYKGYYLHPKGAGMGDQKNWYLRPDIKLFHLGIAIYGVRNWRRFSYRSAMWQNEWQKKSAGSFLWGLELYGGETRADSALVPSLMEHDYKQKGLDRLWYIKLGPGIGYAYTVVIAKHFYLMGSITSTLSLSYFKEYAFTDSYEKFSLKPDFIFRSSVGYNSARFQTGLLWVHQSNYFDGELGNNSVLTGNARLNFVYRFSPAPKTKKMLSFIKSRR